MTLAGNETRAGRWICRPSWWRSGSPSSTVFARASALSPLYLFGSCLIFLVVHRAEVGALCALELAGLLGRLIEVYGTYLIAEGLGAGTQAQLDRTYLATVAGWVGHLLPMEPEGAQDEVLRYCLLHPNIQCG